MSEFKEGDILECIDDHGLKSCLSVGKMYTFEKYNDDKSRVYLKGLEFKVLSSRFIKAQEKEVDTIKLTYAEAWEALQEGKEVFFSHHPCSVSNSGNINYQPRDSGYGIAPFHPTNKYFAMKKEPDYKVLGLHESLVEIEVFGLKTYQERRSEKVYLLNGDGFVCSSSFNYRLGNLQVKLKGDCTKAKIRVTVSEDKQITYEHL